MLKNKQIILLIEKQFEAIEVIYPLLRFKEEGASTILVGTGSADMYRSKQGLELRPELVAKDLSMKDFSAILVPGGYAPDKLRQSEDVLRLIREAFDQKKVIGSICHAAWVLISAGIVKGIRMTCYKGIKDDLKNAGAIYVNEPVVSHRKIVSSRVPEDVIYYCREIIKELSMGS